MNADNLHDAAVVPKQGHGAYRLIAGSPCWRLPSDSDETQLALPAGDGTAGDEAGLAGVVPARRRRLRPERRVRTVLAPCTLEPDAPVRVFDELGAASLACAGLGGSGHRTAYERGAAGLRAEGSVAAGVTGD